ncbi:MAG TPA: hypothetical protein VNL17_07585 [Verrucomicrobiae bacterium]|nr:hypothetical protein [Verrucomicrobiae bacterium]
MSLVHEALQKAEREKRRKLGTMPSAPVSPGAPHPASTPVFHAPVATAPVVSVARPVMSHSPAAPVEEPQKTNNVLLPALIGCVAIVATIAVVFLVSNATSVLRQFKESPSIAASAAPAPAAKSTSFAASSPVDSPAQTRVPPPVVSVADESSYKLSGIMKDPDGKRVAVLDGRVAYEGYFIDGATVKKIETDRVTLDVKGQDLVLRLY